ncbi:MAG: YitT family protein [bacterium]
MKLKFEKITRQVIIDYICIAFGAALMGISLGVFLIDAKVVPGGASGLAMALHYLSGNKIPVGVTLWIINIPLFLWGLKELGKDFGARTFYAFTLCSLFTDMFRGDLFGMKFLALNNLEAIQTLQQNDFLFMVLCGAVTLGVGLGIIFKFKGTTAGSDIVASIMQKKWGMKPGQAIMLIDFFVILFAGIIIGVKHLSPDKSAITLTLYAFFLLYISSRLIDMIIDGFDYTRAVYITSDKYQEIGETIMEKMNRGVTGIKSRGFYSDQEREMVMAVVPIKELETLKRIVKAIDPGAFMVIANTHEVLGEGFRKRI